jgi:hypothetical protein
MPTVYVICPDNNTPTGGILKLYDFVDVLNANHIKSFIVHNDRDFRVSWFSNSTKITDLKSTIPQPDDLLVIPEIWADRVLTTWPGIRKIIYNQDSFNSIIPFYSNPEILREVYLHKDVVQVIVVSDYDVDALGWLLPGIKLDRVYHGINDQLFYFNPNKSKIIAMMPRKGREDYHLLEDILRIKNNMDGFAIQTIDRMTQAQCAEVLRQSAIFLSFSNKEGFGLPPAEAMACGCIVIGYHGMGGKEFFKENLTFNIESTDLFNYAKQVDNVINEFKINPLMTSQIGKRASEYILKNYSLANQEKSILKIIKQLI